jgi:Uri superfamily endonuclease
MQARPGTYALILASSSDRWIEIDWHIDYLRSILPLDEVWYSYDTEQHEHQWADTFSRLKGATLPIAGFGASDCSCKSHLLLFSTKPAVRLFRDQLRFKLNGHRRIFTHKLK